MSISKPEVDFPGGEPPTELQVTDLWEGDGAVATAGSTVKVHYVGVAFSTGEEFDASWNRGDPLEFQLGTGKVIAGWDQGVQGMRVGGRRQGGNRQRGGGKGQDSLLHRSNLSVLVVSSLRTDSLCQRSTTLD